MRCTVELFKPIFDVMEPVEWASVKSLADLMRVTEDRDVRAFLVTGESWMLLLRVCKHAIEMSTKHETVVTGLLGLCYMHSKRIEIWTDALHNPDYQFLPQDKLVIVNEDGTSTVHEVI